MSGDIDRKLISMAAGLASVYGADWNRLSQTERREYLDLVIVIVNAGSRT
jgi:hypothetical protein